MQNNMKKILLFLSFLLMSIGMWCDETTYTFTSKSWEANPANWASGKDGNQMQSGRGIQVTAGSSGANGTSPISFTNVSQVVVTYSTNASTGAGSVAVQIGSNSAVSQNVTKTGGTTDRTLTYTFSPNQTGKVKVTVTCTTNSIYVKSITITESGSSPITYTVTYVLNGGGGTTPIESGKSAGATFTLHNGTTGITPPSGKEFSKWKDQDNVEYVGGATYTMPSKNVTLTAQWVDEVAPVDCDGNSYDFSIIDGFSSWGTGYGEKILIYTNDSVILSSANRQTQTITDIPVTKGSDIEVLARNDGKISSINLICRQWSNKAQTITLHYSTDGGSTYTSTNVTSDNFKLSYDNFDINTNAVKFTFSSSNQIGIESLCIDHQSCTNEVTITKVTDGNGDFDLDKTTVCGDTPGGMVNISNITPNDGYEFDRILCVDETGEETGTVYNTDKKVTGIITNCYIVVLFKEQTPDADISISEWNPDFIKIDIENFDGAVTAVVENKNTQSIHEENVSTKLFFSKYFEAAANIKLWGVYNGTKDTISLANVKVLVSSNGANWDDSNNQKVTSLDTLGRIKRGYICPNEELIVYNDGNKTGSGYLSDTAIMNCVTKNYDISSWYLIKNHTTAFSGDDGLLLLDGTDTLDIIGIMEPDYFTVGKDKHSIGTINNPHGDDYGWCCENGQNIHGDSTALSTNRCLLIRKNTVHSGDSSVKYNRTDFVTLCNEWVGEVVEKHENNNSADAAQTCEDFAYVGDYDYGNYYAQYTEIVNEIQLSSILQDDGSYKINIADLDTLSCTYLKVIVSDGSNRKEKEYKIPIFVTETVNSNNVLFSQEGDDCPECDVVITCTGKLIVNSSLQNRDVTVYPGGILIIPEGETYHVNSLTLRRDNDLVPYFSYKGTLNLDDKFHIDLRTDGDDWRWMTLPFAHKVSDITYQNGKTPKFNSEMFIEYYDGQYRAEHKTGAWQYASIDTTFNAGEGFLFGVDLPGHSKKIYRFTYTQDTIEHEKSDKIVKNLYAYGCNNSNLAPNHKGWNLIGNPFMDNDTTDITDAIGIGCLKKDSVNGHWTGGWTVKNGTSGKLRYAVVPVPRNQWTDEIIATGGYASVLLDDYVLSPFMSFFVQLGGDENDMQTINFKTSKRTNRIAARNYQEVEDDELFLRVKVNNWKTGCFISNKFSDNFEPGDDLESRYPIYQSIGGYKLLYSAINDSIIEHGVQVTAPQGTLYLDPKVDVNKFEYIYVNYNDSWFDLMHGETINIESGRFILQAKRKNNNIATRLDIIPTNGIYKFSNGNSIYINRKNNIFTILGNKVK